MQNENNINGYPSVYDLLRNGADPNAIIELEQKVNTKHCTSDDLSASSAGVPTSFEAPPFEFEEPQPEWKGAKLGSEAMFTAIEVRTEKIKKETENLLKLLESVTSDKLSEEAQQQVLKLQGQLEAAIAAGVPQPPREALKEKHVHPTNDTKKFRKTWVLKDDEEVEVERIAEIIKRDHTNFADKFVEAVKKVSPVVTLPFQEFVVDMSNERVAEHLELEFHKRHSAFLEDWYRWVFPKMTARDIAITIVRMRRDVGEEVLEELK